MLSPALDGLRRTIEEFLQDRMDIDAFEDRFLANGGFMFSESEEVTQAYIAVDEAFSELRFQGGDVETLKLRLRRIL